MKRLLITVVGIAGLTVAGLAGCGWFGGEDSEATDEDFPELGADSQSAEPAEAAATGSLKLNLKVGDRFPLMKTVKQTLSQRSLRGQIISSSELNLLLTITVDEVQESRTRMSVRYNSVRYTHDIAGEKVLYDSSVTTSRIPKEAQAYHGLVNNGFSFWLGADNKIIELVGFNDFLGRSVRNVPIDERQAVFNELEKMSGEEGIANFVDDSIGLLPYGNGAVETSPVINVGHTWERKRQVVRPVPMYLSTKYTLKELNNKVALIDVIGTISPSTTFHPSSQNGANLTIRSGHCFGDCTIDRATGLPLNSQIERFLDMTVQLASGVEFEQQKQIVTTIRTFPAQNTAQPGVSTPSRIQQAAARAAETAPDRATPAAYQQNR